MAAGDDEDPPHPKHRTDEEERGVHSEVGARGRKVNGVKELALGFPTKRRLLAARPGFI